MALLSRLFTDHKFILKFLFILCTLALLDAYLAEHFLNIKPCILCIYQRYVYVAVAAIALIGAFANLRFFILLCGLGFLSGAVIAFYQVGIEQHIFELPNVCKASTVGGTMEELKAQLSQKPVIPCDEVSWEFFGISMAGYNGIFSLFMFIYTLIAYRKSGK